MMFKCTSHVRRKSNCSLYPCSGGRAFTEIVANTKLCDELCK